MNSARGEVDRGLLTAFRAGRRFALAQAISVVENLRPGFEALLDELHADVGRALRIGITGPPGAGKSTLTSRLATAYRGRDETVGIVAVDPSSPFTGGALLGDRIRMGSVSTDPGVFIRSMAARGSLGGLAMTSREVADVMDAYGLDRILTETVGVGQSELGIAGAADTTVVMLVPESGDSIQAMKAGLMEIADLFVVNKSDRPGADKLARELEMMLHMRMGESGGGTGHHGARPRAVGSGARERERQRTLERGGWAVPVQKVVAQTGEGVEGLVETLDRHAVYLQESGELGRRRERRLAERVRGVVDRELRRRVWEGGGAQLLEESLPDLASGAESPYSVAARIIAGASG